MGEDDDVTPGSAAETLRLIQTQQAATARSLTPDPRLTYWPWGVAWLVGFGLLFLRYGPDQRIYWNLPGWLPLSTLYFLMSVAFVVSGVAGARAARQISGTSSVKGGMYGASWGLGFTALAAIAGRLSPYLPQPQVGLLWAAGSVGLVAVLYMAGGAVWQAKELFMLGLWVGIINIVGVLIGPGWHSLIISIGAGGGLLVFGAIALRRSPRPSNRPTIRPTTSQR